MNYFLWSLAPRWKVTFQIPYECDWFGKVDAKSPHYAHYDAEVERGIE